MENYEMNETEVMDQAEPNSLLDWKRTIQMIEIGEEAAIEYARRINESKAENEKEITISFSRSYSEEILNVKQVKICLPSPGAKFLSPISEHQILAFKNDNLDELIHLKIPAHYQNGDMTTRNPNGSLRPTVARHFFMGPQYFGMYIIADVCVTKKTEILSGREMLNINIYPLKKYGKVAVLKNNYLRNGEPVPMLKKADGTEEPAQIATAEYELKLGVAGNGSPLEVPIPESEKYIRFEKINPIRIVV